MQKEKLGLKNPTRVQATLPSDALPQGIGSWEIIISVNGIGNHLFTLPPKIVGLQVWCTPMGNEDGAIDADHYCTAIQGLYSLEGNVDPNNSNQYLLVCGMGPVNGVVPKLRVRVFCSYTTES